MSKRRTQTDEEILDSLDLTDTWVTSSLGSPINAAPIPGEVSWSAFQRKVAREAQIARFPAPTYLIIPEVAFEPRGERPDMVVKEAAMEIVAVLEAKDRARLAKRDVVKAIEKYEPGPKLELLIYVPERCEVAQAAQAHAETCGVKIMRIPFRAGRGAKPCAKAGKPQARKRAHPRSSKTVRGRKRS